jgi:hypothetical protein
VKNPESVQWECSVFSVTRAAQSRISRLLDPGLQPCPGVDRRSGVLHKRLNIVFRWPPALSRAICRKSLLKKHLHQRLAPIASAKYPESAQCSVSVFRLPAEGKEGEKKASEAPRRIVNKKSLEEHLGSDPERSHLRWRRPRWIERPDSGFR